MYILDIVDFVEKYIIYVIVRNEWLKVVYCSFYFKIYIKLKIGIFNLFSLCVLLFLMILEL